MVNFKGDKGGWSGCKFYPDCDTCVFEVCIMEEGGWTPEDLEKAIRILKDCLGKKVNEKDGRIRCKIGDLMDGKH